MCAVYVEVREWEIGNEPHQRDEKVNENKGEQQGEESPQTDLSWGGSFS